MFSILDMFLIFGNVLNLETVYKFSYVLNLETVHSFKNVLNFGNVHNFETVHIFGNVFNFKNVLHNEFFITFKMFIIKKKIDKEISI